MSDDIEVLHDVERVTYTETRKREVVIMLVSRPDIVDDGRYQIGKRGQAWVPGVLRLTFEQENDDPWVLDATLLVSLRLKAGGVSGLVERALGFEDSTGHFIHGWHYPAIPMPDWVPGMIEAHAPEGWTP